MMLTSLRNLPLVISLHQENSFLYSVRTALVRMHMNALLLVKTQAGMTAMNHSIDKYKLYLIEQEKSGNTITSYIRSVEQFYSSIRNADVTKDILIEYKNNLISMYKPATVNAKICAINDYLSFINSEHRLKCVKIHKKISVENIITLAEYNALCSGLLADKKMKHYFIIRFLGETGCRVNELVQFRVEHIRKGYAELFTKGKVRRIYIPDKLQTDCLKWLSEHNKIRGCIFCNGGNNPIAENGIRRLLKCFARRYNIPEYVVYPHSFRHMFAIEFLKRDNDISLLSDLLGHESISTTSIYLKLSSDEQRNRLNKAVNW